jgi:hypothetical protein
MAKSTKTEKKTAEGDKKPESYKAKMLKKKALRPPAIKK